MRTNQCPACGQPFVTSAPNAKYCPVCRDEERRRRDREHKRRWAEKARAAKAAKADQKKPLPIDRGALGTKFCKGCRYAMQAGNTQWYNCDYMARAGHRRPCPSALAVGRRCDLYEPMGKER